MLSTGADESAPGPVAWRGCPGARFWRGLSHVWRNAHGLAKKKKKKRKRWADLTWSRAASAGQIRMQLQGAVCERGETHERLLDGAT